MRSRAFRSTTAILSIMLLAGVPVHAGPVAISEVVQVIGSYQNPPELQLRSFQSTGAPIAEGSRVGSGVKQSAVDGTIDTPSGTVVSSDGSDSLLSGVATSEADPQGGVEIIDQGDVEGTICDCGEITVPGGGFPKWPLLFLAAIPFFFIHDCDDCETPTPTPTPTPPPTPEVPIPEPASLFLLGSGLAAFGAGLRRRYARARLAAQIENTEEG